MARRALWPSENIPSLAVLRLCLCREVQSTRKIEQRQSHQADRAYPSKHRPGKESLAKKQALRTPKDATVLILEVVA